MSHLASDREGMFNTGNATEEGQTAGPWVLFMQFDKRNRQPPILAL